MTSLFCSDLGFRRKRSASFSGGDKVEGEDEEPPRLSPTVRAQVAMVTERTLHPDQNNIFVKIKRGCQSFSEFYSYFKEQKWVFFVVFLLKTSVFHPNKRRM